MSDCLTVMATKEEVRLAQLKMCSQNEPGTGGMILLFFEHSWLFFFLKHFCLYFLKHQHSWLVIENDVVDMIGNFQRSGKLINIFFLLIIQRYSDSTEVVQSGHVLPRVGHLSLVMPIC